MAQAAKAHRRDTGPGEEALTRAGSLHGSRDLTKTHVGRTHSNCSSATTAQLLSPGLTQETVDPTSGPLSQNWQPRGAEVQSMNSKVNLPRFESQLYLVVLDKLIGLHFLAEQEI